MLLPAPAPMVALSSLHSLSSHYFLVPAHSLPASGGRPLRRGDLAIRMGGGPRTYPGGVSKWQWKRMQAKKARQLLKARLARERQLYEMRKRAELRDAVAHLERPWDPDSAAAVVAAAPNLLSVAADDQLRALADRFHRPGGVDLWNDRDGPRVFASPATGAASARLFPRNAVHSVQPYALLGSGGEAGDPRARGSAASDQVLGRRDGTQGVCENAAADEAYGAGDRQGAVELLGRDGIWEPVNALDNGDNRNSRNWSSDEDDDDDHVISESNGIGNGRNGGIASWAVAATTAGNVHGRGSVEARQNHLERSIRGKSTRKLTGVRRNGSDTMASSNGATGRGRVVGGGSGGSLSDSEVILGGSEPKWRRNKDNNTRNGVGSGGSRQRDGISKELDSNSGTRLEPRWGGARNKLDGRENSGGRTKSEYSGNTHGREGLGRYTRANNSSDEQESGGNGDRRRRFGGGFAEDLETPTWKPRRTSSRARNSNGSSDDRGSGRRSIGVAARRLQPNSVNGKDGSEYGRRGMSGNGGRRHWGDGYSLRPTSDLRRSWSEKGSDEM